MENVLLSRFEVARLIGMRALQIGDGAEVKVKVADERLQQNALYVAALELYTHALDARVGRGDLLIDVATARFPDSLEIVLKNFES